MRDLTLLAFLVLAAPATAQQYDPISQRFVGPAPAGPVPAWQTSQSALGSQDLFGVDITTDPLLDIDPQTAAAASLGLVTSPVVAGLSFDAITGELFATDTFTQDLVRIDPATGQTTVVGNTGINLPHGMAIEPSTGTLFAVSNDSNLYEVNRSTGSAALIGSVGFQHISSLDFDPTTGVLYGAYAWSDTTGMLITIDTATGAGTLVGSSHRINGLAFDANGDLFGTENGLFPNVNTTLYSIDKTSGAWTLIGDTGYDNILGLSFGAGAGTIGQSYCGPAVANSTGLPAEIAATGSTLVASNDVTLTCTQLPPNEFGYFLNSETQAFVFPVPNSQGALCLGGAIGRYNAQVQNSGAAGEISIALDLPNTPTPAGSVSIVAGETWHFTTWYRDQNPGSTSNFSNGVTLAFQ